MTGAGGYSPDMLVIGKTIGGGIPAAAYGMTADVAERVTALSPEEDADVGGIGGTLAGYALSLAAIRATLGEVLTAEAFERMIPLAERWEAGVNEVIASRDVPWHVTRLGARAEYHFMPDRPRDGMEQWRHADPELERFLHLWAMNRGILMTPFHNMALMSPATTEADVDRHTEVFGGASSRSSVAAGLTGLERESCLRYACRVARSVGRGRIRSTRGALVAAADAASGSRHGYRRPRGSRRAARPRRAAVQRRELGLEVERSPVLAGRRCLVVEAADRVVRGVHDLGQLVAIPPPPDGGRPRRPLEDRVAPREQRPDLLVGLDPGRREVGALEHPVGERPLAGGGVVDERQLLALVRQIVEGAGLLGLADLPVDEALARRRERVAQLGALVGHGSTIVAGVPT